MKNNFLLLLLLLFVACKKKAGKQADKQAEIKTETPAATPPQYQEPEKAVVEQKKAVEEPSVLNTQKPSFKFIAHNISLKKGIKFPLYTPEGYRVSISYEGLNRLRFLTPSPDGRLFATDMFNKSDNKKGKVLIFDGWNDATHSYKSCKTYLSNLHNCNQVAFYKDNGKQYIYVSETGKLTRYEYQTGDSVPRDKGQIVARFPDFGLDYKYGGWHLTRSLTFYNNKLYVSVGSSCNACIEKEEIRSTIVEMNPDGSNQRFFARGLRNSVQLKWLGGKMWVTSMGRDQIGPDKPEEMFHTVADGGFYGFPFYYQYQGKVYADPQFKDSTRAKWVKEPTVAFCGFKAHSAPLGFDYFKNFDDPNLKNAFLVALHGSNMIWRERGNAVVKARGTNDYDEIVKGFLPKGGKEEKDRKGRPCDVLMRDNKSFFITDDLNGVLYCVWKD